MFGRQTDDIARTLNFMQDQARVQANYSQDATAKLMAQWIRQDRRFDSIKDAEGLARKAMDCRSRGATLNLSEPVTLDGQFPGTV